MYSTVPSSAPGKGPSELEESEEEGASSLCKDWRLVLGQSIMIGDKRRGVYPRRHWIAGGALEGPSSERLMPAIATGRPRVFAEGRRRKVL
jgi:hypothetical protein